MTLLTATEMRDLLKRNNLASPAELDLFPADWAHRLDWGGKEGAGPAEDVRAYRRLHNLHPDLDVAERLLRGGLRSAQAIATHSPSVFARELAPSLGLAGPEAREIHRRAVAVRARTLHLFAAVHGGVASPHARGMRVANVGDDVLQRFQDLPSYQEIFGSLDYCACGECSSILGPAAYFVDLMRIVDTYVTTANKIPPDLALDARRPDLAQIPLTCAKTNDTVPYLEIVVERLLQAVETQAGIDRKDAEFQLATKLVYPIGLPYHAPLDQVRVLLGRMGVPLASVYAAWGAEASEITRESLGLSIEQIAIVTTPATTPEAVAAFYDVDPAKLGDLKQLPAFMERTGLTVREVEDLITQGVTREEAKNNVPENLFINQGLGASFLALVTDAEGNTTIENLGDPPADLAPLDKLNRLRRMATALGWEPSVADWALRAVKAGGDPTIDPPALADLVRLKALAQEFGLAPIHAAILLGPIKTYGDDGGGASTFDRLFNNPEALARAPPYHPRGNPLNAGYTDEPLVWTPGSGADTDALVRVAPGLGLDLGSLNALGASLFGGAPTELSVDALSSLYRHALLCRALNLRMAEYLRLLGLAGLSGLARFTGAQLDHLLDVWRWMVAAGLDVYQLAYAIDGTRSVYVDPLLDLSSVPDWQKGLLATVPAGKDDEQQASIAAQVATLFGVDGRLSDPLLRLSLGSVPPPQPGVPWNRLFLETKDGIPLYPQYVADVLEGTARLLVFAQATDIPAAVLACVESNRAAFSFPTDTRFPSLENLRDVQSFAALVSRFGDLRGDLMRYVSLSAGSPPAPPSKEALEALHAATGWDMAEAEDLLTHEVEGFTNVVTRLGRLASCFGSMAAVGGDVALMRGLRRLADLPAAEPDAWANYVREAALLLAAAADRFGGEWAAMSAAVHGEMDVRLRDALVGVLLTALRAKFEGIRTPNNVYEYLLTDVETGPEAQISYVKEALNAVQLYLQRCRLRLEPGVEQLEIPPVWWEWILNYRTWQANRKVFLYPENYLVPSVRQDKTSLFEELENSLLQSNITEEYVEDAYRSYIESLLDLSDLSPVESFRGKIVDPQRGIVDATYVFARTRTTPYTYYVSRKVDDDNWSEWEKIDVSIGSPNITPVYAFNKLFLFWIQLQRGASPSVQMDEKGTRTATDVTYRATIQYSFENRPGQWVPPQTLVQDDLVLFDGQGNNAVPLRSDPLFGGVFDMSRPAWSRVVALRVTPGNLAPGFEMGREAERIVVLWGPALATTPVNVDTSGTPPENPDAAAFFEKLRRSAGDHDRMIKGRVGGALRFGKAFVLDPGLDGSFVVRKSESFVVDPYLLDGSIAPEVVVNDLEGTLQIVAGARAVSATAASDDVADDVTAPATEPSPVESADLIAAGFTESAADAIVMQLKSTQILDAGGMVVLEKLQSVGLYRGLAVMLGPGTLQALQIPAIERVLLQHLGAPDLLGNVPRYQAAALPVRGQPAWLRFDGGDESFLWAPALDPPGSAEPFSSLESGLVVSAPPIFEPSFLSSRIDLAQSARIYTVLHTSSIVNAQDIPDPSRAQSSELETVLAPLQLSTDQLTIVRSVLLNYPIIDPADFGLRTDLGVRVFKYLQDYRLIDLSSRAVLSRITGTNLMIALRNVFTLDKEFTRADAAKVYRALVDAPAPFALSYRNLGSPGDFLHEGRYAPVRLTTAAVARLQRALLVGGIERVLSLQSQNVPVEPVLPFARFMPDTARVIVPAAADGAQVDFDGLYGRYFWELFYHGPMLVANALSANQRFMEALAWFQKVFDPTLAETFVVGQSFSVESDGAIPPAESEAAFEQLKVHTIGKEGEFILVPLPTDPSRCRVNPGYAASTDLSFLRAIFGPDEEEEQRKIQIASNILLNAQLATPESRFWTFRPFRTHTLISLRDMLADMNPAVRAYNNHPFDPFAIARLRIDAFEKATVMQYVDALIRWGDALFTLDTWESLTAATMVYVYASDLLGPRPDQVGLCDARPAATLQEIRAKYEHPPYHGIPQFLIDLESMLPPIRPGAADPTPAQAHAFNDLGTYFCVPENDVLVGYWDRIDDRLTKIRRSMNIKGEVRVLALFEPPLDPMALVRAAAASNNVQKPAAGATPAPPPLRFAVTLDRARSLAATLTSLGSELLSALERRDAEHLSSLTTTQAGRILALTTQIKEQQIEQAQGTVTSLQAALAGAQARLDFYTNLLNNQISSREQANLDAMATSLAFTIAGTAFRTGAAIGYAVPQVGSPFAMTYGGVQLGAVLTASAGITEVGADAASFVAQRSLTMAGYDRRTEDWRLQQDLARDDVEATTAQIAVAKASLASARQDLVVHDTSIAQNEAVEAYLRSKFTTEELYGWMSGRILGLYSQTYQLALAAARSAQAAYQFDRRSTQTFLAFDDWDGARKGLLAGPALTLALDQMEAAYAEGTRALEIERMISLAQIDPAALYALKTTGKCSFSLTEALFDYDYPGQYGRTIKTVSLSIPAIVGPYQNVKAILTQTSSDIAIAPDLNAVSYLLTRKGKQPTSVVSPPVLPDNKVVAISRGVDDSGLFVLDFQDARYLPFEGSGAVSSWTLEMPPETNAFDFEQLSDVILTLRYTARSGGDALETGVKGLLRQEANWLRVGYYLDMLQAYPTEWETLMREPPSPQGTQTLAFPFTPVGIGKPQAMRLDKVLAKLSCAEGIAWPAEAVAIAKLVVAGTEVGTVTVTRGSGEVAIGKQPGALAGDWQIVFDLGEIQAKVPGLLAVGRLDPAKLLDLELLVTCAANMFPPPPQVKRRSATRGGSSPSRGRGGPARG